MKRFAIGNAERPLLRAKIGWLDHLANATHQFYTANNTGGPGIKVLYIDNFPLKPVRKGKNDLFLIDFLS